MGEITQFLKAVIERSGTKFLIALAAEYFIYDLAKAGVIEGLYAAGAMFLVALGFYVFRHFEKINQTEDFKIPIKEKE